MRGAALWFILKMKRLKIDASSALVKRNIHPLKIKLETPSPPTPLFMKQILLRDFAGNDQMEDQEWCKKIFLGALEQRFVCVR